MFIKRSEGTVKKVHSDDDLRNKTDKDLMCELSEDVDLKDENKKTKEC